MATREIIESGGAELPIQKGIEFGKADDRWSVYGLREIPVLYGGAASGYKAIVRNDDLVTFQRRQYQLLPNEEAVKYADQAAELAGLVPFNEFKGEWLQRMNDHVIQDRKGLKVHALYCSNRHYTVAGQKMHLGVGIHNSIDGSMGFGCGIFTFRNACANMVFAGMRGYHQEFDQRKTLEFVYKPHRKSLVAFEGGLKNVILRVMEKVEDVLRSYREMAERAVTEELIQKIRESRLPKRTLPEWLQVKSDKQVALDAVKGVTEWNLYNDITAAIWHNPKSDIGSKEFLFDQLHKVMPLQVRTVA